MTMATILSTKSTKSTENGLVKGRPTGSKEILQTSDGEFTFCGPLNSKNDEQCCNYLMIWLGDMGQDNLQYLDTASKTRRSSKRITTNLKCEAKIEQVFARYKSHNKMQQEGESFVPNRPAVTFKRLWIEGSRWHRCQAATMMVCLERNCLTMDIPEWNFCVPNTIAKVSFSICAYFSWVGVSALQACHSWPVWSKAD